MLGATKIVKPRALQGGVVLFIALIVLVLMTLAAIAMVRSVDTTNIIAGNLAFKQAAAQSADAGVEAAINWLEANAGANLWANNFPNGYSAVRQDPSGTQTWDQFWIASIDPNPLSSPPASLTCSATGMACTLPTDGAGNTVTYTISRMCKNVGDPNSTAVKPGCPVSVAAAAAGSGSSNQGSGQITLNYVSQYYYRITARVVGPRNTVSYIQTMVAI
jgi:type IV pilus assembly protein PilX